MTPIVLTDDDVTITSDGDTMVITGRPIATLDWYERHLLCAFLLRQMPEARSAAYGAGGPVPVEVTR